MVAAKKRRRAVVLGVPALVVGAMAVVALWQVGEPVVEGERGAAPTIGFDQERPARLVDVEVRQLTSAHTFWAGQPGEEATFVVADRPVPFEPGAIVTIVGRVEAAPDVERSRRQWGIDQATARAVRARGVYLRAIEVRAATPRR